MERSLTLTFLEDQEIISEAFNSIDISLKQAINKQEEMEQLVRPLEVYKPKNPGKKSREEILENAKLFFQGRNLILYVSEENILPLPKNEISQHEE